MNNRSLLLQLITILTAFFGSLAAVHATPLAAIVQATADTSSVRLRYQVTNQSNLTAALFDISLFVISAADGSTNPVINADLLPNWVAQSLTAASWEQPMGDPAGSLPTWHQYTGMEFLSWVPSGPLVPPNPCFGYFLAYLTAQ